MNLIEQFPRAALSTTASPVFVNFDSAFSRHCAYLAEASSTADSHFCASVTTALAAPPRLITIVAARAARGRVCMSASGGSGEPTVDPAGGIAAYLPAAGKRRLPNPRRTPVDDPFRRRLLEPPRSVRILFRPLDLPGMRDRGATQVKAPTAPTGV